MALRSKTLLLTLAAVFAGPVASAADVDVRVQSTGNAPVVSAIVYAVPAAGPAPAAGLRYNIDQVDREFVPRVNVVQTGTAIRFPNSDNIRHSVYSFSPAKIFTLKLYAGKSADAVVFDKPGLVVLGCNIHDKMVSWLLVVDTPYFAVTDRAGAATLSKLPPGEYTLHTWHEPMTEDQQVVEALRVDPNGATITRIVHIVSP